MEGGDFNWACFKAHQAAEFAVRGLLYGIERPARGHSVSKLLDAAKALLSVPKALVEPGKFLDKFYIPTRYVDAWSEGAPFEYFTRGDAEAALAAAEKIIAFVEETWRGVLKFREELRARALTLAKAVARALPGTALLVGSYARGDFSEDSDVDLMVVAEFSESLTVAY
jgi:HEPN domain-containing protein